MNDQSQIEAKIIHLTPPQRFQVAHQLPKDHPAESCSATKKPQKEEYKGLTNNNSKISANRILKGIWLLVTLILKRFTRIDKNLLIVYVALVLLLLQVFLVISKAEASTLNSPPLMTRHSNLKADWQHTRSAQTFNHHYRSNALLAVQPIERTPVSLAKNPPWQLRLAPTCPGTGFKAAGAAAAFWFFFAAEKELGHAPAMRGSIKSQQFEISLAVSTLIRKESMRRGRATQNPCSPIQLAPNRVLLSSANLSHTGVPQMITSPVTLT